MRLALIGLLLALLIAFSCNIGLINRHLGLQNASGSNLVSGRDILVVLVLICTYSYLQLVTIRRSSLTTLVFLLVIWTPVPICIGLLYEGALFPIVMQASTMLSWALAPFIAGFLIATKSFSKFTYLIMAAGLLVAIGVFVETVSRGTIAVVTPAVDALEKTIRSTPTGWPLMVAAGSFFFVNSVERKASFRNRLFSIICFGIILLACFLTQSRTLIVGIVCSSLIYIAYLVRYQPYRLNVTFLAGVILVGCTMIPVTLIVGEKYYNRGFNKYWQDRYLKILPGDGLRETMGEDARSAELLHILSVHLMESPIFGKGFGVDVWDTHISPTTHNIIGFWALRYGMIGLLFWFVFVISFVNTCNRHFSSRMLSQTGLSGYYVAMWNILICAVSGNVFGTTYGAQQAMIILSCIIAADKLTFVTGSQTVMYASNTVGKTNQTTSLRILSR